MASTLSNVTIGAMLNFRTLSTTGAVTFRTHKFCFFTSCPNGFGGLIFFGARYFFGRQSIPPPVSLTYERCRLKDPSALPILPGLITSSDALTLAVRPSSLMAKGSPFRDSKNLVSPDVTDVCFDGASAGLACVA
jgi:hypothetical protein